MISERYRKLYNDGGYGLLVGDIYPQRPGFPHDTEHFSSVPISDDRTEGCPNGQRLVFGICIESENDIETNLRNDYTQRKLLAIELFHMIKEDRHLIEQVCGALGIRTHRSDIVMLINKIYEIAINDGHELDRFGLLKVDNFISIATAVVADRKKKAINVVTVNPKIKVRFAHMVNEADKPELEHLFRRKHGDDWKGQVYRALFIYKRSDFLLGGRYSSTILNDSTILVYPHDYKKPIEVKEPLWYEEDLVVSQSYFSKENESTTDHRGLFDRIFR